MAAPADLEGKVVIACEQEGSLLHDPPAQAEGILPGKVREPGWTATGSGRVLCVPACHVLQEPASFRLECVSKEEGGQVGPPRPRREGRPSRV